MRPRREMPPVKVALVIGQLSRGGAEGQLFELVRGLDRARFQPMVISLSEDGYWAGPMRRLGVEVVELRRRTSRDLSRLFALRSTLKDFRPDIVHTMLGPANTYGRLASLMMLTRRPRLIAAERGLEVSDGFVNRTATRMLAPFTSAIIANSEYIGAVVAGRTGCAASKIRVIYNGIDAKRFDRPDGVRSGRAPGGAIVVGTVARISAEKDFPTLLAAAAAICGERDDVVFQIVGDGPMRAEVERAAREMGLADRVEFCGMSNDIPAALARMDIFVLSSHTESLPNVVLEAMCARLPVVATDVGGCKEVVVDGQTGMLVPPSNPRVLAGAITTLIDDETMRRKMAEAGRQRAEREFSMERMVTETERLYMEVAAGAAPMTTRRKK